MNGLTPVDYQGQRILTTSQLAESYGTESVKIQQNFNNNKDRYGAGKHFFLLEGSELKDFKGNLENFDVAQNVNKLYLWTEKGAWLHAKSLNTDSAWEAYEMLVDDYYAIKQTQSKDSYTIEDPIKRAHAWIVEAEERKSLILQIEEQMPRVIFTKALEVSKDSILIRELATMAKQNGVVIGQNRLFEKLREHGYLIKRGDCYNQPTQKSMDLGLMEIFKRFFYSPNGSARFLTTTKITGKGQVYFVNKLLKGSWSLKLVKEA